MRESVYWIDVNADIENTIKTIPHVLNYSKTTKRQDDSSQTAG